MIKQKTKQTNKHIISFLVVFVQSNIQNVTRSIGHTHIDFFFRFSLCTQEKEEHWREVSLKMRRTTCRQINRERKTKKKEQKRRRRRIPMISKDKS